MINEHRTNQNLEIISAFKNKTATQNLLKNYTGWGGLRKAIYTPGIYKELKNF